MTTLESVTLPVFSAPNVYVTTSPAALTAVGAASFVSMMSGDRVAVTDADA
jgi:hypothetical protein